MRKNRILVILLLALSMRRCETEEHVNEDRTSTCIEQTDICVDPIKAFLKRMVKATTDGRKIIKVFASTESLPLTYLRKIDADDIEIDGCDINTIYIEHLLDRFTMYWIPIKEETFLYVTENDMAQTKEALRKILSEGKTNSPCMATTTPPTHDCSNICNRKTSVVTSTKHPTTGASPTTTAEITSTPASHFATTEQNTSDNCVQVYIIVIACICSFLAGAVFSLFVCMFCRSDKFGKKKANPTHDIVLDNTELPSQETSTNKIKSNKSDVKTYETLNSSPGSTPDKASTDHVYFGISSNSSLHYKSDVNRSNGKEIQPSQTYESCKQNKEDHVYNTLKAEKTSNIYTETKATESQEHTYTGLSKREAEDLPESVNQSSLEESESIHNRSSDGHNYFILEDEVKGRGTEVTSMPYEVQDKERHMMENDDDQSEGHNYFTLEKPDHLNNPVSIIDHHDAMKQPDNDNDGPTYHILEKE